MAKQAERVRTVVMGAAGRDFHNFNAVYREDEGTEVVAFTAAQIPGIGGRVYPATLAGPLYPEGIPIRDEAELESICLNEGVGRVVFAYSDVPHETVMHLASRVLAAGADFLLLGPDATMLRAHIPVIAVDAVRTGCGKSQVARWISRRLRERGLRVGVIRHPMPYGILANQAVQRFATRADLAAADCTIEEREEYEPHIAAGGVIFAGVDYSRVLAAAEAEADIILWDGGNNDFPFVRPDLHLVLTDALRPGHEDSHHPGEAVLRMADAVIIAKTDSASPVAADRVAAAVERINPRAAIVRGASPVTLDGPEDAVRGRRVLVVEDGPTITHGGMDKGAGHVAATRAGAAEIIDPRTHAAPAIAAVFDSYPHIGPVLPAVGYDREQLAALAQTIARVEADVVIAATPIDLAALIEIEAPCVRARYEYADAGGPTLGEEVDRFLARLDSVGP